MSYSFEVVYKPRLDNKVVDALSRMPPTMHLYHLKTPTLIDLKKIQEEDEKNEGLKEIVAKLQNGEEGKNYSM